jgi:hypothetical protein
MLRRAWMAARRVDHRLMRSGWNADNFSYRLLPDVLVLAFGELEAEAVAEVVL